MEPADPTSHAPFFEGWCQQALASGVTQMISLDKTLRAHARGILASFLHPISTGKLEGINNKIKSISHRSFGFRSADNFIAAIYHCCARLLLPVER